MMPSYKAFGSLISFIVIDQNYYLKFYQLSGIFFKDDFLVRVLILLLNESVIIIYVVIIKPMQEHFHHPISFQRAKKHMLANRIFKGRIVETTEECPCCFRKVGQEEVQTSCNIQTDKLPFLGPGVPLFFLYLKSIIQLLVLMTLIFMGFALYSNAVENSCSLDVKCIQSIFNIISVINKQSNLSYLSIQAYLALLFIIVAILYLHYFRYKARQLQRICDEVVDSPSDYAIIIRRLPKGITQKHIQDLVGSKIKDLTSEQRNITEDLKIIRIVISYELREYTQIHEENIKKFKEMVENQTVSSFIKKDLPKLDKTSTIAIVVFQSQLSKSFFIHEATIWQKIIQFFCTACLPLSNFQINETKVSIQRAPQPDDIVWQNSGITVKGAITRKVLYGLILMIVLMIGGGMQYGLALWSFNTKDQFYQTILTFSSSLFVTIFNAFLTLLIHFLTIKERNQTLTQFHTVLMVKMTIFQFLNAGIFVLLAETIVNFSNFTLKDQICEQITIIMILNALLPNIILFFLQYIQIINRVKQCLVKMKWIIMTQIQVNDIFAGPTIDLSHKYAYILKTLLLTALYATITPIVIAISTIGLLLFYFIQKFLYTHSYRIPNNVSSESFRTAIELLEYFLITFALGELLIYYYFYKYVFSQVPIILSIVILVSLILSALNAAIPMDAINERIFKMQDSSHSQIKYTDIEQKLEVTYEMTNPAYQSKPKRHNIKDVLVFFTFDKQQKIQGKKQEIQMSDLIKKTAFESRNTMIKQPLLQMNFQTKNSHQIATDSNNQKNVVSHGERAIEPIGQNFSGQTNKQQKNQMFGSKGKQIQRMHQASKNVIKNKQADIQSMSQKSKQIQIVIKTPSNINIKSSSIQSQLIKQKQPRKLKLTHASYNYEKLIAQIFDNKNKTAENLNTSDGDRDNRQKSISSMHNEQKGQKMAFQDNITHIYADLGQNSKVQSLNKGVMNFEDVPICSKYHQSGGKANIYQEFIVQKSASSKPEQIKRNLIAKAKKQIKQRQKPVQLQSNGQITFKKQERNKFRFIAIRQVNSRDEDNEKQMQQKISRTSSIQDPNAYKDISYSNLLDKAQKINHFEINQRYRQNISKFQKNSSSSAYFSNQQGNGHKDPEFKEASKQKKATYDPLRLNRSYKQFFKAKESEQSKILSKGRVMKYLGTPFTNFIMQEKDGNPFFK